VGGVLHCQGSVLDLHLIALAHGARGDITHASSELTPLGPSGLVVRHVGDRDQTEILPLAEEGEGEGGVRVSLNEYEI
jgi:hypothetical protein